MTNETSKLIKSNVKEINQTREMKSKKIMTRIRLDQEGHHKKVLQSNLSVLRRIEFGLERKI